MTPASAEGGRSLPAGLSQLAATPDGAAWLSRVPHLLERARERWQLELSEPFSAGSASWTTLARRLGEQEWSLVLKISFPHPEAADEAEALMHWHGHGAPRLVDVEPEDWALLMAAVRPGTPLSASLWPEQVALRSGARVVSELHAVGLPVTHGFGTLADTVRAWGALVAARAREHRWAHVADDLVAAWRPLADELLATSPRGVLLHGDANPGNLLAAEDEHRLRWYAIDPKPLVGDPAFDPWPLLEQIDPDPFGAADPVVALLARCRLVAPLLGTTAWRVAAWSFVRRLESTLWLAAMTAPDERHSESATALDLARQWDETRVWWRVVERARAENP